MTNTSEVINPESQENNWEMEYQRKGRQKTYLQLWWEDIQIRLKNLDRLLYDKSSF